MQYEITFDQTGIIDSYGQLGWNLATGSNGNVYLQAVISKKQLWTFNEDGSIQNSQCKYLSLGEERDGGSKYAKLTTAKTNLFDILVGGKICVRGTNYAMIAHRYHAKDKVTNFHTLVSFHNNRANKWKLTESVIQPIQYSYSFSSMQTTMPTVSSVSCSCQFQNVLKSKGIKDETIAKLKDEGIVSVDLLRECTSQMLQIAGIKIAQVITLKKL